MKQSLFLVLSSHLFPIDTLRNLGKKNVIMIEDYELFTRYKYHKKKLIFVLEAMRNYADELREKGFTVTYIPLTSEEKEKTFEFYLKEQLTVQKCKGVESYEIEERFLRKRVQDLAKKENFPWTTHKSPMFLHSIKDFSTLFPSKKHPRLRHFYEAERKEKGILIDRGKPVGGKFSFDKENRKKIPKSITIPPLPRAKKTKHHQAIATLVNTLFADHPGDSEDFWLPTSRSEALKWLEDFIEQRLPQFGHYEDAIAQNEPFLFHSALSPLLNIGLLTPDEVIEKALAQNDIPINSLEGFIRQIIGWREFIKGIDECFGEKEEKSNFFGHRRLLSPAWWSGETGLIPVDNSIKKALRYGYCHHIERLMILSNAMLLLEIEPKEVYRWFMEMFVDSADWVMGPNVYGMGQFSDGGIFATKPYICGANYLRKMGDFPDGEWCDIFDGLYWKFIDRQRDFFRRQPRLNMMVATLDKMNRTRRNRLFSLAAEFQKKMTR